MTSASSTNSTAADTSGTSAAQAGPARARDSHRQVREAHELRVQVEVWGTQDSAVHASSGGGRGGRPYLAVTVGQCLTYVYDFDALSCHLQTWREAAKLNRTVRLGEFGPSPAAQQAFAQGQDLTVVSHVTGGQPVTVHANTRASGRPVLIVTVGAVTIAVHTTTALTAYLHTWTRAGTAQEILEQPGG